MDTQKMLSLVDVFVPFLPLEREHVRVCPCPSSHLRHHAHVV